jgi:hypothetical protein
VGGKVGEGEESDGCNMGMALFSGISGVKNNDLY